MSELPENVKVERGDQRVKELEALLEGWRASGDIYDPSCPDAERIVEVELEYLKLTQPTIWAQRLKRMAEEKKATKKERGRKRK